MTITQALNKLLSGQHLVAEEMSLIMHDIMTGQCTDAQIAGFLIALRLKGETVSEISAAASVMRSLSTRVEIDVPHLIDTCGTGGDGSNTFNISTTSALVAAAAGANVAKHGNRSVSSRCGSADLLESAGVKLDLNSEQIAHCIQQIGIGFLFAPLHHSAMRHAINARKQLGVRTLFNLLGPLTNPAAAPRQLIGVFDQQWLVPVAEVLKKLGTKQLMVVHSADGLDEISLSAATHVAELKDGTISEYQISPEQFGFKAIDIADIAVDGIEDSLQTLHAVLDNDHRASAAVDIVCLNAGAAIYTAGLAADLSAGIDKARSVIADGTARQKLQQLVELSQSFAQA